jgi:hypothetical protein
MTRMLELTPELADAIEKQDLVPVRGRSGICFIIRGETLERIKRQLVEEESDRSFYESEGEIPLGP